MKRSKRKASMRSDTSGGSWRVWPWGRVERRIHSGQRRAERKRQARREIEADQ